MANLQVTDTTVPALIKKLQSCEWLVPNFQREFVWSNANVISLINSIIDAKPIGMLTLWEQEGISQIDLEPVSVSDWDKSNNTAARKYFGDSSKRPGRFFAILDGRQRSTALAMAFGGLRADSGLYKSAGRYFLDVSAKDDTERVRFISEKDVKKKKLDTESVAIAAGLFPLECKEGPDGMYRQWMRYIQEIKNAKNYPEGVMITAAEIERRNDLLTNAFAGIIETKIAVYIVPSEYDLASICEIFETLNTTGTKVSTVDLIHNFLVMDTQANPGGPLLLRERIDDLGTTDGAVGWSNSRERPEIIAQFATAAYVISDQKPDPRSLSGGKATKITSVKSGDLLALPAEFWQKIFQNDQEFAGFIGDFQKCVADGYFGMRNCPYPASAAVYIGLRWHHQFDDRDNIRWSVSDLNSLYRAFFWRNCLSTRYDQGFLTQIGADLKELRAILELRPEFDFGEWASKAEELLGKHMAREITYEQIEAYVSDGDYGGAIERAVQLLYVGRARKDFIDPNLLIDFYSGEMQIHHVYPKDWCNNNRSWCEPLLRSIRG